MVFVWPVVISWSWGGGWLTLALKKDLIDVGGAINVHMFAGAIGLIGALFTGHRRGRWRAKKANKFVIQNQGYYIIGSTLTILGIFGLNMSLNQNSNEKGLSAANTWICAGVSSIVSLKLLTIYKTDLHTHTIAIYQGFIAGMVIISDSGYNTTPWQAGLTGILSGVIFASAYMIIILTKVDDVLNVTATWLAPGLIGGFLPGFLTDDDGVFWDGISGHTLSTQVIGVIVVLGWALTWACLIFGFLKILGTLTLGKHIQKFSLDRTELRQTGWIFINDEATTKR